MQKIKMLQTCEGSINGFDEDLNGIKKGKEGYTDRQWYKYVKNTTPVVPDQLAEKLVDKLGYAEPADES